MVIICSKCNKTYNIDASKIPAAGVMATCKKCGNRFRVHRKQPPAPIAKAPTPGPVTVATQEKKLGLKPLAGLTKTLRVLLVFNIIFTVMAVAAGMYEYDAYMDLPPGFDIEETIIPAEIVSGIVGLFQVIVFIILGITFLRWIYRTNRNLAALSGEEMRFTPGWSVGWYFIPIANLFKPYQAMKEIWEISHKNQSEPSLTLILWWACWLISNYLGEFALEYVMGSESVAQYSVSTLIYIASDGFDVVLNIVALILVTQIGKAYSKNYSQKRLSTGGFSNTQRPTQRTSRMSDQFVSVKG